MHVQVYDGRNVLPGSGRSGTVLPGYGIGFPGSGGLPWFRVVFLRVVVIAQDNQCIKFNLSEKKLAYIEAYNASLCVNRVEICA